MRNAQFHANTHTHTNDHLIIKYGAYTRIHNVISVIQYIYARALIKRN